MRYNTYRNSSIPLVLCSLVLLGGSALEALGNGFRLPDQDGFASGRGEAFVATADNPSAVFYNPAGITQLRGHEVRFGFYGIYLKPSYDSPSGGHYENQNDLHAIPRLFYTYTPEKFPLSAGLGVYAPYGLGMRWPESTGFRTVGIEADLSYMTLHPVVAWKILPSLSIAAGPTFNYSETDLRQGLLPTPGPDKFRFKGDATDIGYTAGVRWQPLEWLSFGASYRSETSMDYEGHTEMPPFYQSMPANAEIPFPQNVVMGVSFRPTLKWNIEFNADYTDWSRLNSVPIRQQQPVPPLVLNWESSWYWEFGVTRYLDKGWRVSAGYIFNENAVPDANYNPVVADMDRHFFCLGVGYQGKHVSFDVAYQFGYGPSRTVSGSAPSLAGQTADGEYDFISHVLSVSVGWRF